MNFERPGLEHDVSPAIGAEHVEIARTSWLVWVENHKGDVTLGLSALLYVTSLVVLRETSWNITGNLVRSMGEASLVGGLCDYIALKMIFERRWYLPNSGVLPRNREKLINGIAAVIENKWLTPEMIGTKLRELKLAAQLGRFLENISLERTLDRPQIVELCERIGAYVDSEPFKIFLEERLRAGAPRTLRIANSIGLASYESLAAGISRRLHNAIIELPSNADLLKAVEVRIRYLGEELQQRGSVYHKMAYRLLDMLVEHAVTASRGEISRMVKENLSRLSDDEIRHQIESRTRTHLDWIRVNGGIFGALFGAIFGLLNFAFTYGAGLIPSLH